MKRSILWRVGSWLAGGGLFLTQACSTASVLGAIPTVVTAVNALLPVVQSQIGP
jgi:hypothetical protein